MCIFLFLSVWLAVSILLIHGGKHHVKNLKMKQAPGGRALDGFKVISHLTQERHIIHKLSVEGRC
jgi:hypothetical protein